MKTIYKYHLETIKTELKIPKGGKILKVGEQHDWPTLWVCIDTENDEEKRIFLCAGTGQEVPEGEYIGTVQFFEGELVWHIYEVQS